VAVLVMDVEAVKWQNTVLYRVYRSGAVYGEGEGRNGEYLMVGRAVMRW